MKSREHVVNNGRASFYACMWEDLRNAALDCGWALALHGSLNKDMDIMAMPWVEDARPVDEMIQALKNCFTDNMFGVKPPTTDRPHGRIIYTINIWSDFYLDISIIKSPIELPNDERNASQQNLNQGTKAG